MTIGLAESAIAGLYGQLAHPLQYIGNRVKGGLFLGQAALGRRQVAVILTENVLLLLQLQQPHRGDRVIRGGENAIASADLLLGTGRVTINTLYPANAIIERLDG